MKLEMYTIKDELSEYAAPLPFTDCDNAKRYFRTQLEENVFMKHNKKDFSLWYMGLFDTVTGEMQENFCKLVERGVERGNEENTIPDNA